MSQRKQNKKHDWDASIWSEKDSSENDVVNLYSREEESFHTQTININVFIEFVFISTRFD